MTTAKVTKAEKTVVDDRKHALEAAVVRVMKHHMMLDHLILFMAVPRLCNPCSKPEPGQVKTFIDDHINREFLAREDG